ncbi:MAG: hypothetical protein AB1679_00735 [Actinomycetota bacterium]
MATTERFPPELGGKRDFDYITPKGRRLTEYEAVTCYTQPQVAGGGLQAPGEFQTRPDGRPLFDLASTRLRCDDWFAYRDPNQMWQRPYYVEQAEAEKSIERACEVAFSTGAAGALDPDWVEAGLVGAYFPFSHYEYGLFRGLNMAARESLSDTINSVLVFNAADKLRHAQAISILGLDLESTVPGLDGTAGKKLWLEHADWQPLRRLVEEVMAIRDWCEMVVAVNLVVEPLIGEPMRRLVFQFGAASRRDILVPVIAGTASADWHRNSRAMRELVDFLSESAGGEGNRALIAEWVRAWRERTVPVAQGIFAALEASLPEPDLQARAKVAAEEESQRVGADLVDAVPSAA